MSDDKTVRRWEAPPACRSANPWNIPAGWCCSVALAPTARRPHRSADKAAQIWDAATDRPSARPWRIPKWCIPLAFSPDGKTVMTAGN